MNSIKRQSLISLLLLGAGFVLTAAGSIWVILTPVGAGVNYGAAVVYFGGMLVGVVGLVCSLIAFSVLRRKE